MRWTPRDALAVAMTMLAAPRFRLAALVAAWAGALRHDPWAADVSLGQIADEVRRLYPELQDDPPGRAGAVDRRGGAPRRPRMALSQGRSGRPRYISPS
jgi:hypothetical protein